MSDVDQPQPDQPDRPDQPGEQDLPAGAAPGSTPEPAHGTAATPTPSYGEAGVTAAPVGQVRETGTCILLMVVTLGFYSWYWYYKTHEEMRQHTGTGIGGPVALILAILVGVVMPFFSSHEVGQLYERRGQARPVSAVTGLWALLLGWFFFVGAIVWFVKTNGALNDYWRSLGAED